MNKLKFSGARILIVDDDEKLAQALAKEFEDLGFLVKTASRLDQIPSDIFEAAILDVRLRGEMGHDAISLLRERNPDCKVVMLSGYGSIASAVDAMRRGAEDFLTKPVGIDRILAALNGEGESDQHQPRRPSLAQIEHEYIDFVLIQNEGNITKTASQLGLHRQSLQRKLKKYT
jgi:two-component system response regulator RegA